MNFPTAIIFALHEELKPLLRSFRIIKKTRHRTTVLTETEANLDGLPLIFCKTGMGMANAHEGIERLIETYHPRAILSVGYSGAARPDLKTGDLILPSVILSETPTDHFKPDTALSGRLEKILKDTSLPYHQGPLVTLWNIAHKEEKIHWGEKGVLAVDMETAAMIAVSMKMRVPFASLRVIFDTLEDTLALPKSILKIPKFIRMNQLCKKNLHQIIFRFVR